MSIPWQSILFSRGRYTAHKFVASALSTFVVSGCLASTTLLESNGNDDKHTNFQVMAALEAREELQKVRLAQLIHDLHKLAQTTEKGRFRRYVTMTGRIGTGDLARRGSFGSASLQIQPDGWIQADFVRKAIRPSTAQAAINGIKAGGRLSKPALLSLILVAGKVFERESTLIDLRNVEEVTVVGDLHGSMDSLNSVLNLIGDIERSDRKIVFNGDFVDRGNQSLEVICTLLLLKMAHPEQVFLLRGNHEDSLIASVYGFQDELRKKYGADLADDIWANITHLFSVLPVAARTDTALIVHGGLPSSANKLDLDKNVATLSLKDRSMLSMVHSSSSTGKLMQQMMWSDPDPDLEGKETEPNPRGLGVQFGPRVARDFLERHGLKYLVRSHEPVPTGCQSMNCGHNRFVLTVFSAAAYPNGEGTNAGAIVTLNQDGSYKAFEFQATSADAIAHGWQGSTTDAIRSLVSGNMTKLEAAFESAQNRQGRVTRAQWADIMARVLDLQKVPWFSVQPSIAPTTQKNGDMIDWKSFLRSHSAVLGKFGEIDKRQLESLHTNHLMFLTVFKFLDTDGSGSVDRKEFLDGITLLNKRLPEDRQLRDPESLFKVLDRDGNGQIDLEEFEQVFNIL